MKYKKSKEIFERIKSANKIVLSVHHHPDSDTVACATVLSKVISDMGKETKIICPDHIPSFLNFLEGSSSVQTVKFEEFDFSEWDLMIVCDTSTWGRLFIEKHFKAPDTSVIVIDNHSSNPGFGDFSLLDYETSSVAEMIYNILSDWNINITKNMATSLFAGMAGDSGSFRFEVYKHTFDVADKLVKMGADVRLTNYNLFDSKPIELIKFLGVVISNLIVDEKGFVYAAIPYSLYKDYLHVYGTREVAATDVIAKLSGTKFGFIMTEEAPSSSSVSFRSREGIDTSKIAVTLGGGGHPAASGAWIRGVSFEKALENVLEECRKIL